MFNNVPTQSTSAYDKTRTNTQKRNIKQKSARITTETTTAK
jgi:hypothetical protein